MAQAPRTSKSGDPPEKRAAPPDVLGTSAASVGRLWLRRPGPRKAATFPRKVLPLPTGGAPLPPPWDACGSGAPDLEKRRPSREKCWPSKMWTTCRTDAPLQQDTEQAHQEDGSSSFASYRCPGCTSGSQRQGREEDGWGPLGRNSSFVILGEGYEGVGGALTLEQRWVLLRWAALPSGAGLPCWTDPAAKEEVASKSVEGVRGNRWKKGIHGSACYLRLLFPPLLLMLLVLVLLVMLVMLLLELLLLVLLLLVLLVLLLSLPVLGLPRGPLWAFVFSVEVFESSWVSVPGLLLGALLSASRGHGLRRCSDRLGALLGPS